MEGLPGVCVLSRADVTSQYIHEMIVNLLDGRLADAVIRFVHTVNVTMLPFPLSFGLIPPSFLISFNVFLLLLVTWLRMPLEHALWTIKELWYCIFTSCQCL